jgi:hypothetical protein
MAAPKDNADNQENEKASPAPRITKELVLYSSSPEDAIRSSRSREALAPVGCMPFCCDSDGLLYVERFVPPECVGYHCASKVRKGNELQKRNWYQRCHRWPPKMALRERSPRRIRSGLREEGSPGYGYCAWDIDVAQRDDGEFETR